MPTHTFFFTVPGPPRGKGRPRFSSRGGFARAYTDGKTVQYEKLVRKAAEKAGATCSPLPCTMEFRAVFPVPVSYPKKKREAALSGTLRFIKKPDTDNISKMKDALNGVAFMDDNQVYKESIEKVYGSEPRLDVTIVYDSE